MDRGKSLAGIDRDRLVRHRNQMHDIALQKQISVIQREGKLIERELREITKVKNTLMQIRSPLKKRVLRQSEGQSDCRETKRSTKKCQTSKKPHSSRAEKKEQWLTNTVESSKSADGCEVEMPKLQPIAKHRGPNSGRKQLSLAVSDLNSSQEQVVAAEICTLQPTQDTQNTKLRKKSFGKHEKPSKTGVENLEKRLFTGENCTLPPVDVFKSNGNNLKEPELEASIAKTIRSISATPPSKPGCVPVQDRPETSATVALRKSKLSEQPLIELSLPAATRSRYEQQQEELTLTMEETLRIKGKFRQIGHSIIATALLKGIKQRGHLTSEAIHNMHKPVMVSDKTNQNEEEEGSEENDVLPVKTGLEKFRKVTRKAMYVNAFVSNGRQKSVNQLQQGINKTNDEGEEFSQDSSGERDKAIHPRKRFAGAGHAILFTKTIQGKKDCTEMDNENRNVTKKPLMNSYTQERRKKFSISAMATSPSPDTKPASELPKSKVVTFRLDHAWE